MTDKKQKNRKRKNPGALSVFDELDESFDSNLVFEPKVDDVMLREIKIQSQIADAPTWERHRFEQPSAAVEAPSPAPVQSPTDELPTTPAITTEILQAPVDAAPSTVAIPDSPSSKSPVSESLANREATVSSPFEDNTAFDSKAFVLTEPSGTELANRELIVSEPLANRSLSVTQPLSDRNTTVMEPLANRELQEDAKSHTTEDLREIALANRYPTVSEPLAKRPVTVSQPSAHRQPSVPQPLANRELQNSKTTEGEGTVSQSSVNREATVTQPLAEWALERLTGKKLEFVKFVFDQCRFSGELQTNPIVNDQLLKVLETTTGGLRQIIFDVNRDGIVECIALKKGRVGLRVFRLAKNVHQRLLVRFTMNQPLSNREATVSQLSSQPSFLPSSSSSKEVNTTNTGEDEKVVPAEWRALPIPPTLRDIGFGRRHIEQLSELEGQGGLSADQVQESLEAFAFDLGAGTLKVKTTPLNFLLGIIFKNRSPYVSEPLLSSQKQEMDEYLKRVEELSAVKGEMQEAQRQARFEAWMEGLNQAEKNRLAPPSAVVKEGSRYQILMLKEYWGKNVEHGEVGDATV